MPKDGHFSRTSLEGRGARREREVALPESRNRTWHSSISEHSSIGVVPSADFIYPTKFYIRDTSLKLIVTASVAARKLTHGA